MRKLLALFTAILLFSSSVSFGAYTPKNDNGQENMAGSEPVVIASDQSAIPVSQSGTWTVQPGNTANTTAWKVDGSAVTQPVSGTFWQATQPVSGTVTADAGTNLNTSALALESGGNLASLTRNIAGATDSFGHIIVGDINNDIDVQFYRANSDSDLSNIITETESNGGTASRSNGMATFASTTTSSSRAKGVSLVPVVYTAGAEVYMIFTAAFPTATGGTGSYRRIGLYNDLTDGFFIGYETTGTFGVSLLKGGSITTTLKANFSNDTLVGGAGSLFTRAGTPEAIDLTKLNVFRIRFGWVGSAPIEFEVLSPDGSWVTFHTIKQPNLTALPSINTADLYATADVFTGTSGNAQSILSNCWGAGTTQKLRKLTDTLTGNTLAGLTRSVITGATTGGGGGYVNVKVNPSGALTADVTGTVAATQSGTWDEVGINDSGNSITVDGTVTVTDGAGALNVIVDSSALPSGASTLAEQQTQTTSLQLIDDGVYTDDTSTHSTGSSKGYGIMAAAAPTDTALNANDIGMVGMTANRGLYVSVQDALPAGTNAIGKLAANSGVDIGDVDVTSIAAGNNNIGDVDVATLPNVTIGTFPDNEPFNLAQVNGTTTPVATNGTNTTGAGVQQTGPLYQADDVATGACTENQFCPPRINATRRSILIEGVASGTAVPISAASATFASGSIASGALASGSIASGAIASGAIASGAIASGAIASGAIAAGAIAAGATSIAENEDVASAGADRLVKVGVVRLDTPVSGANVSGSADYLSPITDSFGKLWQTGTYAEDLAHIDLEALTGGGQRRIDTAATSAGASGDWATENQSAEGASWATLTPTTTSGLSVANATSSDGGTALTNTAQAIKASAGNLYGYYIYNPNSSAQYVQFYNTASASVTVGTTNPLFMLTIPATSGANLMFPYPVTFSNAGWSWSATSTAGGNGAPTTALEAVAWYK